jgi:hypothetical protein
LSEDFKMTSLSMRLVKRVDRLPKPSRAAEAMQPLFETTSCSAAVALIWQVFSLLNFHHWASRLTPVSSRFGAKYPK